MAKASSRDARAARAASRAQSTARAQGESQDDLSSVETPCDTFIPIVSGPVETMSLSYDLTQMKKAIKRLKSSMITHGNSLFSTEYKDSVKIISSHLSGRNQQLPAQWDDIMDGLKECYPIFRYIFCSLEACSTGVYKEDETNLIIRSLYGK